MRFQFNFKRPVRNSCSRRRISVCKPANDVRIPVVPDQDGGGLPASGLVHVTGAAETPATKTPKKIDQGAPPLWPPEV